MARKTKEARIGSDTAQSTKGLNWKQFRRSQRALGLVVVSVALLGWVFWYAGPAAVWNSLRSADRNLIALGIPIILASLVLRASRWRLLLLSLGEPCFWNAFRSMVVGYMGNNLLPARGGDLVRAYLLGREAEISKSAVLGTIAVERVADTAALLMVSLFLLMVFPMPAWVFPATITGGAMLIAIVFLLAVIRAYRAGITKMVDILLSRMPARWKFKGISLIDDFLCGVTSFRRWANVVAYLGMTIVIWATDALLFWLYLQAFGVLIPVASVVLLVAIAALSTAIPALPGYVGTYQFVLVNTLTFLGVLAGPAVAFAIAVHGAAWLTVNLLGVVFALRIGETILRPLKHERAI